MTDELAQRRAIKAEQNDTRLVVNSYGPDGYVLVDVPVKYKDEIIEALQAVQP